MFEGCEFEDVSQEVAPSAFAFETLAHDMQNTMLALTKQTLSSAEFDGVAQDVLDLDVLALTKSVNRSMPVARRVLASYRDTVVVFADAVSGFCASSCGDLPNLLNQLDSGTPSEMAALTLHEQRIIQALRSEMKKTMNNAGGWYLGKRHITGLMYHMDQACRMLALQQAQTMNGKIVLEDIANCGPAFSTDGSTKGSPARSAFLSIAVKE